MEASTSGGEVRKLKVVLLGEGAVGKTSLVLRYVENKFTPKHYTTLQASFMSKKLNINGRRLELNIWDTAGQEKFHALGPIYYRDSQGAILVYDVTDQRSFQNVKKWVQELRRMLGEKVVVVIAGNKTDLDRTKTLDFQEAAAYAKSVGATHHATSAKLDEGIEQLFLDLSKRMLDAAAENDKLEQTHKPSKNRNLLVVEDDAGPNQPQKRCC